MVLFHLMFLQNKPMDSIGFSATYYPYSPYNSQAGTFYIDNISNSYCNASQNSTTTETTSSTTTETTSPSTTGNLFNLPDNTRFENITIRVAAKRVSGSKVGL